MFKNIFEDCAYAFSHGVDKDCLGLLPLYYALAYINKSKKTVVVGSGGGVVPMAFRQAQRDLGDPSMDTWLVDGFCKDAGFGDPEELGGWALEDSVFKKHFPDVKIVKKLTKDCRGLFEGIDLLHIDAEHTYEAVLFDFDVFAPALSPHAIVTFHDTVNPMIQRAVMEIAAKYNFEFLNLRDMASGLSILRKSTKDGYVQNMFDDCKTRPEGHEWNWTSKISDL